MAETVAVRVPKRVYERAFKVSKDKNIPIGSAFEYLLSQKILSEIEDIKKKGGDEQMVETAKLQNKIEDLRAQNLELKKELNDVTEEKSELEEDFIMAQATIDKLLEEIDQKEKEVTEKLEALEAKLKNAKTDGIFGFEFPTRQGIKHFAWELTDPTDRSELTNLVVAGMRAHRVI